ncbi:unnamed protein product [Malus baccata var. baccata]
MQISEVTHSGGARIPTSVHLSKLLAKCWGMNGTTFFRKWEKTPIVRKSRKRDWENDGNAIGVGIIRECMPIILENLALYKKRGNFFVFFAILKYGNGALPNLVY